MRIIRDFKHCPTEAKNAVVALGNFDGIHRGHQVILQDCLGKAKAQGLSPAVMTFEPHPREFFARDHQPLRIYPLHRKLQLLKQMGIDTVFLARFNQAFAALSAAAFAELLHKNIAAKHIICGYDFAFGKNRQGNTDFLQSKAREWGMGFTCIAPVTSDENPISSSVIRTLLAKGDMQGVEQLLGRPYSIGGRVRGGDKRGRTLGFPTANLWLETLFRPRFGIYAARVKFKNGTMHDAVANLGIRPMFATERPLLEVHCFDLSHMFYGERIEVQLIEFIREEKKFDTLDILRAQMAEDCERAKKVLTCKKSA
jgi:riboflavin kinase/FMN adenylyltransferase